MLSEVSILNLLFVRLHINRMRFVCLMNYYPHAYGSQKVYMLLWTGGRKGYLFLASFPLWVEHVDLISLFWDLYCSYSALEDLDERDMRH